MSPRIGSRVLTITLLVLLGSFFAACGDDDSTAPPSDQAFNGTIHIVDNRFSPATVTISVGDSVTWRWEGSNSHTVTHGTSPSSIPNPQYFDEGPKTSGTFGFRFTKAETVPYFCQPHFSAGMKGTIVVKTP